MKGIVLAGGSGTRLHPLTLATSKQLLPIYDKPMVYYPISVLMQTGIREILIISTPNDLPNFQKLLGDGSRYGVSFSYKIQPSPDGLAQAFIIGEDFIEDDNVCMILGDNLFFGAGFEEILLNSKNLVEQEQKAIIFGNYVNDPHRYGVASFDDQSNVIEIVEKPQHPKSNYAVVGLYFYPNSVVNVARNISPSWRGELEITSVNQHYLKKDNLKMQILSRGFAWLDTGTHDALTQATEFVKAVEKRTGLKIGCIEEIAFNNKWITAEDIKKNIEGLKGNYYEYLKSII